MNISILFSILYYVHVTILNITLATMPMFKMVVYHLLWRHKTGARE